jgi:hypothetical protein
LALALEIGAHGRGSNGHLVARIRARNRDAVIVYAVVNDALSPDCPLGVELEVFVRSEDAERFVEEVCGNDPEVAAKLSRWLVRYIVDRTPKLRHLAELTAELARAASD